MEKKLAPIRGNRPHHPTKNLAPEPSLTKLYRSDWLELKRVCEAERRTRAEVLREMVRIGFRVRRLRSAGTDATMPAVKAAQREVVEELLTPIYEALDTNAAMRKRQGERIDAHADTGDVTLEAVRRLSRDVLRISEILWEAVTVPTLLKENQDLTDEQLSAYREREDQRWEEAAEMELERARDTVHASYGR